MPATTRILWPRRIPFDGKFILVPVDHAAFPIGDVLKAETVQDGGCRRAADAGAANHDDVPVLMLVQLFRPRGQVFQRNKKTAGDMPKLTRVFLGLANV